MILYTPLCESDIFPESADEAQMARQFISYQGRTLHVEKTNDGSYQLLQLLSTDPHDYLNDQFAPGNIIS